MSMCLSFQPQTRRAQCHARSCASSLRSCVQDPQWETAPDPTSACQNVSGTNLISFQLIANHLYIQPYLTSSPHLNGPLLNTHLLTSTYLFDCCLSVNCLTVHCLIVHCLFAPYLTDISHILLCLIVPCRTGLL